MYLCGWGVTVGVPLPKFSPRSYYSAAQEHLGMCRVLLSQRQYFVAHYFAAIAVEAILRAPSVVEGEPFDGTHHIEHWANKANLIPEGSDIKQDEFRGALDEVNTRWRANQRYYTAKMLDTYLSSTELDKVRGLRRANTADFRA